MRLKRILNFVVLLFLSPAGLGSGGTQRGVQVAAGPLHCVSLRLWILWVELKSPFAQYIVDALPGQLASTHGTKQ